MFKRETSTMKSGTSSARSSRVSSLSSIGAAQLDQYSLNSSMQFSSTQQLSLPITSEMSVMNDGFDSSCFPPSSQGSLDSCNEVLMENKTFSGSEDNPSACHNMSVLESEFDRLDTDGDGLVSSMDLLDALQTEGLLNDDPRMRQLVSNVNQRRGRASDVAMTLPAFVDIVTENASVVVKTLHKELTVPGFNELTQSLTEMYESVRHCKSGHVSGQVPDLSKEKVDAFSVSICTIDGQRWSIGDSQTRFCLKSCGWPLAYMLALEELGSEFVHQHVGCEPSGVGFSEMALKSIDKDSNERGASAIPHNPLVNAGGIMIAALLLMESNDTMAVRFKTLADFMERMCGGQNMGFSNSVYLAEKEHAHRNFALAFMMLESQSFPKRVTKRNLRECLDLYFQLSALEADTGQLAVMGATMARGGVCPLNDERISRPDAVRSILSIMSSCGLYDFSGQWAFNIGLPAKTSPSGACFAVIPNLMGIAIFSPRLDKFGNSVRAVKFCEKLVAQFSLHVYETIKVHSNEEKHSKIDLKVDFAQKRQDQISDLLFAAAAGDVYSLRRVLSSGVNVLECNYDNRTALHVASSNGHYLAVQFLLSKILEIEKSFDKSLISETLSPVDRWNRTPLDDAISSENSSLVDLLKNAGAVSSNFSPLKSSLFTANEVHLKPSNSPTSSESEYANEIR